MHCNINLDVLDSGTETSNLDHGLGTINRRIIFIPKKNDVSKRYTQLITWEKVLLGRKEGIQIWEHRHSIHNSFEPFCNQRKTDPSLNKIFNELSDEHLVIRFNVHIYWHCITELYLCHNCCARLSKN